MVTRSDIDARVENLNRRFEKRGSVYRYTVEQRNGYTAIDRIRIDPSTAGLLGERWSVVSMVTAGTKREVADFLFAAVVALDDAGTKEEA